MYKLVSVKIIPCFLLCFVSFVASQVDDDSQLKVLYVKANDSSPCPHEIPRMQCQTLDWYMQNINNSFTSNTTMNFLDGHHSLTTFLQVYNCHKFSMIGVGTVSYRNGSLVYPSSIWIHCSGTNGSGVIFINSSDIHISNIGFDSCSAMATLERKFIVHIALAFDCVINLTLHKVVINNSKGFGLHCDNVFGQVHVIDSVFTNARGDSRLRVYGGNARFWFGAPCFNSTSITNLTINNSWFMYGNEISNKHHNASGLQVLIFCPKIQAIMNNITVYGNKGINGGNLALCLNYCDPHISTISISNSNISNGWAAKGAGIRFWSQIETSIENNYNNTGILTIENSIFSNNEANTTGGAMYIAHYETESYINQRERQIKVTNCTFMGNKGNIGAAMEILKQTIPGYVSHITPQFSVYFHNCQFDNNSVPTDKHSSIMELIGTENIQLSECSFTNSHGTVFSLRNSNLNLFGNIYFKNNYATYGGALKVCDSSIIFLHNGTSVMFVNNRAQKGGAIYAQQGCLDTAPACFFQPALNRTVDIVDFAKYVTVKFVNNSASIAGDAIYGGSVDYCYTLKDFSYNGTLSFYNNRYIFHTIVNMTEQSGLSYISSDPRGVCFCDLANSQNVCKNGIIYLTKFPGELFSVTVTTIGQFKGITLGVINANLSEGDPTNELITLNSTMAHRGCVNLTYLILSSKTEHNITIHFNAISTDINAYYKPTTAILSLSLLPCPLGFHLNNRRCDCNPLMQLNYEISASIRCEIDTQTIHIPEQSLLWLGYGTLHEDNQSLYYLTANFHCFHYCSLQSRSILVSNKTTFDDQCLLGRTGVLCGACKPELSCVLGSYSKCKLCSNQNLIFLIPLFLLSGVFIVAVLTFLNLTVTEGTVSALIIYANIIYTHQEISSTIHSSVFYSICWGFIAWLNFDIGFELCFYNGMNGYQQIWLLYGYIMYLITIQVIIVMLCRRFIMFTRIFGRNIIKVLATLLFLMCSPLSYAILETFRCTTLHVSTQNTTTRRRIWYNDGNVPCYGLKHLLLFIVSVLCAVVVFFFIFSLLLVQCLQKRTNLLCFRWVEKLRPLFDAFTGPCRDNYRFWPGFLMFMRLGLYVLNYATVVSISTPAQKTLRSIGTAALCMIILSLSCIFPHGVYKKWPLNMLEFSFFLNLCLTSVLLTIFEDHFHGIIMSSSITITMLTFLAILIYHIIAKIGSNVLEHLDLKKKLNKIIPIKHRIEAYCCLSESSDNDETTPLLPHPLPTVLHYDQYREPLIGNTNN